MNVNTGHFFKLLKYYKSISMLAFVLLISLLPADNTNKVLFIDFPHIDKVIHFIMYFLLSLAILFDIYSDKKKPTKIYALSVLSLVLIFSGIIEIIQELYIDSRSGSYYDLISNFIGLIFGFIIYRKYKIIF